MEYYHSRYGSRQKPKRKNRFRKFLIWFFIVVILLVAGAGYYLYKLIFEPNIWTPEGKEVALYIPTGSDWDNMRTIIYKNGLIVHRNDFEWLAVKKNLPSRVLPGKYIIKDGLSNNDLIDLLRSGEQVPVKVIFNNVRNVFQLAEKVGGQIEADSASIATILSDTNELKLYGLTPETAPTLFIPNTYEFYWNTNAQEYIDRMHEENQKFWNSYRTSRAKAMEMTKEEIITLASIVEKESNKNDEKPAIAGVYINRLISGWRLQADPTVVFAVGDFNIRRVLNVHKKIDSPYLSLIHI